jgi:hypothetical protein
MDQERLMDLIIGFLDVCIVLFLAYLALWFAFGVARFIRAIALQSAWKQIANLPPTPESIRAQAFVDSLRRHQ